MDLLAAHRIFEAELAEKEALPGADAGRVSLAPKTLTPATARTLDHAVEHVHGALERLVEHTLASPDRLSAWGLDATLAELVQVDPGYPGAVEIARFDGLLADDGVRFLEFNCDSPGGAARADAIDAAYERTRLSHPRLGLPRPTQRTRRLPALHRTLVDAYEAWRTTRPDRPTKPRVVVTDWADVGTRADIDLTVAYLAQRGLDVTFADPRELTLDGDVLVHEDRPVDLVYKRVITRELVDEPDAQAVLTAYRAGTVCLVNPPRSILAGDKRALAALFDPEIQAALTPAQRTAVDRYVPFTRVLEPGRVDHDGRPRDLRDVALEAQDQLVLKPAGGYGGDGVHLGFETSPEAWGRLVDQHIDDGDWILQALVPIPQGTYTRREGAQVERVVMNENVNPFVFGGRHAGSYTRISPNARVNVSRGGAVAPTIVSDDPVARSDPTREP